jgi:two-component system CheB/CheR fusion protein
MKKILVVEDDADSAEALYEVLMHFGYLVKLAEDGLRGLEAIHHTNYDLVISDINMPNLDGLGFARKVREQENIANVPLLALTSSVSPADIAASKKAGFDAHIGKPVDIDVLIQIIGKYV